jgi:hypothetical protein
MMTGRRSADRVDIVFVADPDGNRLGCAIPRVAGESMDP